MYALMYVAYFSNRRDLESILRTDANRFANVLQLEVE